MVTLLRKVDVEATLRGIARALQVRLRRRVRGYMLLTALALATGTAIAAGSWYFHYKGTRVPEEAKKLAGPFEVENLGAKPAEGVVMRWRIRMGTEQPIPRWHLAQTKKGGKTQAVLLEDGKSYRLRLQGRMQGILQGSFTSAEKAGARSEATLLSQKVLGSAEGIPILPEKTVHFSLRWTPDTPGEEVTLLLDELEVPAAEYRSFLESQRIEIRPVYIDP